MLENNNVNNTDQQQAENNSEVQQEPEVKTFTQDEVNDIVEKRLNRERKKFSHMVNGGDPKELELAERERALDERELRIDMKDVVKSKNLPDSVLDYLDYKDRESCEKSLEVLEKIVGECVRARLFERLKGDPPPTKARHLEDYGSENLGKAFGLK